MRTRITCITTALIWAGSAAALAQISVPITSFESDRDGEALLTGVPGYSSLEEIFFQDPSFAEPTIQYVVPKDDWDAVGGCPECVLPDDSLEESYVDTFLGGANSTLQSLHVFFSWVDPTDTNRWVRLTTLQPPNFPSPAIHLGGQVKMKIRVEDIGFGASNLNLGFGLLVRETGTTTALGFNGGNTGDLEFVGLSNLLNADSNGPTPVPAVAHSYTGPTGTWVDLTFNLATESVHGWTAEGGNGVLEGTRGVLEALVIMPTASGVGQRDVFIGIDEVVFDAPVDDPAIAPRLGLPVIESLTTVRVNDVLWTATQVSVEVDQAYDGVTFVADQTINQPVTNVNFVDVGGLPALQIGDAVRARQTNSTGTSPYSTIVEVTPPPVFTVTLSLDENGDGSLAPADFEFVGASTVLGTASPQGKPVFAECGVWQKVEFSLIPGVEPVVSFAGGDGILSPDGGQYSFDAVFFSMNLIEPFTGPYAVYFDHLYIIDENDQEVVLNDAESVNPFSFYRGNPPPPATFALSLTTNTSYDGVASSLIQWSFANTSTNNALAAYRTFPGFPFDDTAKALGFYILVEDCSTSGPPRPTIPNALYAGQTAVRVGGVDAVNATSVDIYLDGVAGGSLGNPGASAVDVPLGGALTAGQIVNATQTTGLGESEYSLPKAVAPIPAPTITSALVDGDTSVDLADILALPNATASLVTVYEAGTANVLGTAVPGGTTASVNVPTLDACESVEATQTVNGIESARSTAQFVGTGQTPTVVINEWVYDDGGTDNREFVELYNYGAAPVDISGWVIYTEDNIGPNLVFTINSNSIIAAGDYFVLGDAAVPNVDQVLTGPGSEGFFENSNEAIQLRDQCGAVLDTVRYEMNKGNWAIAGDEGGMWGNIISEDAGMVSFSRHLDGRDTNINGRDFSVRRETPGASNNPFPLTRHYSGPAVDLAAVGSAVPDMWGSFVPPTVIDPTVADAFNTYAIPASPDGGNAMVAWDPAGGGNTGGTNRTFDVNGSYDIWVYLDATSNGNEQWNIGIAGTPDYWAQNNLVLGANGSSGVSWQFLHGNGVANSSLRLVDHGAGGHHSLWVTLAQADLTGYSEGWYRLAIYLNGTQVVGVFDDQYFVGVTQEEILGTFYIGYREDQAGVPLADVRPPTIDERAVVDDCQPNGTVDYLDIANGVSSDCNANLVPDECEVAASTAEDCDADNVPDDCELSGGQSPNPAPTGSCADAPYVGAGQYTGSTSALGSEGSVGCEPTASDSPAAFYKFVAGADGVLTVSLCGSSYDTVLSVYSGCPAETGNEIACNDDFCSTRSSVFVPVTKGQELVIRVSGWSGANGNYVLTITGVGSYNLDADCNADGTLDDCQPAITPGDFNLDGNATLADFVSFTDCLGGPGVTPVIQGACTDSCLAAFDLDADDDVDLADYQAMMDLLE